MSSLESSLTLRPHVHKDERQMAHDQSIGWGVSIVISLAVVAGIAFGIAKLKRKVDLRRADRELDEHFFDLEQSAGKGEARSCGRL